jgi:pyrroline-5-carboxylate reductase
MRIGFIGGGTMGETMVRAILDRGLAPARDVIVGDTNAQRCTLLSEKYGVISSPDNREVLKGTETVILAVKPQALGEVVRELKGLFEQQLVLSIVAGAKLSTIIQGLGYKAVVRAMPNMPAQISEGITVWTDTPEVSQEQKEVARLILSSLGKEIYVADENYIDMATAVSGSGPAYIFLIIESLIDAAVHLGLPHDMARELVVQTTLGSARMIQESGRHPAELREAVTSPGGTTAEGLLQLEKGGLRAVLSQAVTAAHEKAKRLGGK